MSIHLVTGGSGFVGSNIVQMLYAKGEHVRVLDIIDSIDRPPEVEFVQGDILNPSIVEKVIKGVDYVYHTVALVPLTKAGTKFWDVNVKGTQLIIDAAQKENVIFFIHISTTAIYGGSLNKCPITEETPPNPIEIYGRAKLEGENRVLNAMNNGFQCAIIRPRTIIGAKRLGIFQILFEWIIENKNIYLIGKGDNLFQFLHVQDLAEMCIICAEKNKAGTYNIGAEKFSTLRNDLTALIEHAESSTKIIGLPIMLTINCLKLLDIIQLSPLAPWHYLTYHNPCYFDITKTITTLEWKPKFSNEEMLFSAYDWYKNYNEELLNMNMQSTHLSPVKQKILKLLKFLS